MQRKESEVRWRKVTKQKGAECNALSQSMVVALLLRAPHWPPACELCGNYPSSYLQDSPGGCRAGGGGTSPVRVLTFTCNAIVHFHIGRCSAL